MRVLVCGSRFWTNRKRIEVEILRVHGPNRRIKMIIQGGASGADYFAGVVARCWGIPFMEFPAQWKIYGRPAGPIRNQLMLDEGKPDLIMAFHDEIDKSRGTADMIKRAQKAKIEVQLFKNNNNNNEHSKSKNQGPIKENQKES